MRWRAAALIGHVSPAGSPSTSTMRAPVSRTQSASRAVSSMLAASPTRPGLSTTRALVRNSKGLEKQTIADIAFLDQHTANSDEGQKRLRKAVQMMGQYLRQTFSEAGINSNKAVFVAQKMQLTEQGDVDQALVVLHAYEPDSSRVVNGTALITRWRKTADGWKLDMNPYLDNFRTKK